jgi:hypothetical protein
MAEATILGAVRQVVIGAIVAACSNRIFEGDVPETAAGLTHMPQGIVEDGGAQYTRNSEADQTPLGGYELRRVKVKIRSKTQSHAQALLQTALLALCPVVPAPPAPFVQAVEVAGASTTFVHPADGQVTLRAGTDAETGLGWQEAAATIVVRVTRP